MVAAFFLQAELSDSRLFEIYQTSEIDIIVDFVPVAAESGRNYLVNEQPVRSNLIDSCLVHINPNIRPSRKHTNISLLREY